MKIYQEKDPDHASAPLVGVAYDGAMGLEFSKPHTHQRAQLLYCSVGSFQTEVSPYEFIVPPTTAILIPAGTPHSGSASQIVKYRSLYICSRAYPSLPQEAIAINVSPLLKELILKACQFPWDYTDSSAESRLADVIIDEIIAAPKERFVLPITNNDTLRAIKIFIIQHLNEKMTAEALAKRFAMSGKTLSRLCKKELGMTFETWRQQIKLIKAIELLSLKRSTTDVAQALGYNADSAFIYQFKKLTGKTPSEFIKT